MHLTMGLTVNNLNAGMLLHNFTVLFKYPAV
jgi:hypothetical protein